MDVSVRQQLSDLVEELTHSGAPSLDETLLKKLKRMCKSSDDNIQTTYNLIMSNVAKKHSEVRLSAFQIAAELFPRSHLFRLLLTSDFQRLTQLVTGTDPKHPLPPPHSAASRLKESSLLAIRQWHERFGDGYPKLKIGYNYLKYSKKVDFDGLVAQTESVRRQNEARAARRTAFAQQRLKEIHTDMTDQKNDIDACLRQMESCFHLLLPQFGVSEEEQFFTGGVVRPPSGGQGNFRNRTLSSGSFASLEDMEYSSSGEGEEGKEEEANGMEAREGQEQKEKEGNHQELGEGEGKRDSLELGRDGDSESNHGSDVTQEEGTAVEGEKTMTVSRASHEGKSQLSEMMEGVPLLSSATSSEVPSGDVLSVYGTARDGGRKGNSGEKSRGKRKGKGKGKEREGPGDGGKERGEGGYSGGSSSSDDSDVEWEDVPPASSTLQEHGFVSHGVSIPIELSAKIEVEENEDNSSILTALSENLHLLQEKYLPSVNKWLEWLTKAGGESDLKEAIDLKDRILTAVEKCKKMTIKFKQPKQTAVQTKTQVDTHPQLLPSHPSPSRSQDPPATAYPSTKASGLHQNKLAVELEQDPTTIQAQLKVMRKSLTQPTSATKTTTTEPPPSSSSSSHSQAPVVPFDMDLYHWGSSDGAAPLVNKIRMSSVHQYWGSEKEVELCDDEKALSKCRKIQFAGKFEPVKWSCRAPLPSGRLCPRRDRLKCPFHGPIIPRDEHGNPVNTTTTTPTATPQTRQPSTTNEKDFNDIEAEVFAAKGIELPRKGKRGKRGRQKKHPGLTDLAAHSDTSRKRLERKILSKKALRRVADVMDGISAKRFRDKFADSFNYALRD